MGDLTFRIQVLNAKRGPAQGRIIAQSPEEISNLVAGFGKE